MMEGLKQRRVTQVRICGRIQGHPGFHKKIYKRKSSFTVSIRGDRKRKRTITVLHTQPDTPVWMRTSLQQQSGALKALAAHRDVQCGLALTINRIKIGTGFNQCFDKCWGVEPGRPKQRAIDFHILVHCHTVFDIGPCLDQRARIRRSGRQTRGKRQGRFAKIRDRVHLRTGVQQ